jgi:hypothetical protein
MPPELPQPWRSFLDDLDRTVALDPYDLASRNSNGISNVIAMISRTCDAEWI